MSEEIVYFTYDHVHCIVDLHRIIYIVLPLQYLSINNTNGDHEGDEGGCLHRPCPPATLPSCAAGWPSAATSTHSLRSGPAAPAAAAAQPSAQLPLTWTAARLLQELTMSPHNCLEFASFYIDHRYPQYPDKAPTCAFSLLIATSWFHTSIGIYIKNGHLVNFGNSLIALAK